MKNMTRVLLLGGARHLDATLCDSNFPAPITTGNGTETVTCYHRAIFRFPISGAVVDSFWFVYESDNYRGSEVELPLADIHQVLVDKNMRPANEAIDVINLVQATSLYTSLTAGRGPGNKRLYSMTCRSPCKLAANGVYSYLLCERIGYRIDDVGRDRISST